MYAQMYIFLCLPISIPPQEVYTALMPNICIRKDTNHLKLFPKVAYGIIIKMSIPLAEQGDIN